MVMHTPKQETKPKAQPEVPLVTADPPPVRLPLTAHLPIRMTAGGPIVTHFQPNKKATENGSVIYEEFVTDEFCVDRESVRRKFGWGMLGGVHNIPFIYRNGDKYSAVRMVEAYIGDFLAKISDNIYLDCTNIFGYYVTVPEIILLNEINEFHCDNFYGAIPFKQCDVLVKLDDANEFYEFLTVCSNKLLNTPCNEKRCGFLTINDASMVPYIIIKEQKFLPLFYFDGMEGIKFKVQKIKGWNLSYLKFCFKVHGIRDEFCKNDDITVIALEELISHLDPSDSFTEIWPAIPQSNKTIFQPKKINKQALKRWHQHPITVLPVSTVKYTKLIPKSDAETIPANPNAFYRTISHS